MPLLTMPLLPADRQDTIEIGSISCKNKKKAHSGARIAVGARVTAATVAANEHRRILCGLTRTLSSTSAKLELRHEGKNIFGAF